MNIILTLTKIKQERANQDRTKIGPFFDFLLHFSIYFFEILNIASQLSCEAMLKTLSKNIEKCRRKSKKGPILILSRLVLSCLIFVTVIASGVRIMSAYVKLSYASLCTSFYLFINNSNLFVILICDFYL